MKVRAHTAMVFHLDKCIGCHTCSVACKNVWTDRRGAEYMWWNNVETKPGTGYPTRWEDQAVHKGGFEATGGGLRLRAQSKAGALLKLFYNPNQPGLDNYYEPWTYRYADLFDSPAGDDQPTAVPVSLLTGKVLDIEAGPNWDDDLSGSPIYAESDPNLAGLTPDERKMLFSVEGIAMMYLPRICNHCLNPGCVAACPSGAIYKRGEDGIVLINQDACRGWRACVAACPYKKTYFNWQGGKSEKCILCYPRVETGQAPACFHSCVGRIRYLGVLLYDAEKIESAARAPTDDLVRAHRDLLLDPNDPAIAAAAIRDGVTPETVEAARRSPVWQWVKAWELALPLHPEFRTLPMLYYVPPLLPVLGRSNGDVYAHTPARLRGEIDAARIPIAYLASLFSAGNVGEVERALHKLAAVRLYQRNQTRLRQGGAPVIDDEALAAVLADAGITAEEAEAIYRLTALCDPNDRFVLPPGQREELIDGAHGPDGPETQKGLAGFGCSRTPKRGA